MKGKTQNRVKCAGCMGFLCYKKTEIWSKYIFSANGSARVLTKPPGKLNPAGGLSPASHVLSPPWQISRERPPSEHLPCVLPPDSSKGVSIWQPMNSEYFLIFNYLRE
jgi:hypothetical protein